MNNAIELINTKEGIHTVYNPVLNESYHSLYGSLQESMHVFINNGLNAHPRLSQGKPINILEMGFGTGLNAILTYRENLQLNVNIRYSAVEAFPLTLETINKLNYFEYLDTHLHSVFLKMHVCNWFQNISLSEGHISPLKRPGGMFTLYKIQADMLELKLEDCFDLIYYDAFSPTHQPELWTFEVIKKIYDACNPGALLVTYCAKGEVKRTLAKVGFNVEAIKGPEGKREMIRATKASAPLSMVGLS